MINDISLRGMAMPLGLPIEASHIPLYTLRNTTCMRYRMKCAEDQEIPITNYGTAIAYMQGILKRSLEIFPYLQEELF